MASQEEINQVNEFKSILQARITAFQNRLFGTTPVTTITELQNVSSDFNIDVADITEEISEVSSDEDYEEEDEETDLEREQRILREELGA